MKKSDKLEKVFVIENEKGKFWYAMEHSFLAKDLFKSTWFSNKKRAISELEQRLLPEGLCKYGTIRKFWISKN